MLDHLEVEVSDLAASRRFYAAALAPLGYQLKVEGASLGFGDARAKDFWIKAGTAAKPPLHYAFNCSRRLEVEAAYAAALDGGGRADRSPSLLPQIHSHYFAGFVFDPDGNKIEFVCHTPA
jgi:catechol 2,3-dioxygenase-like lactoylglutathione lyase family enzyme